jgi:hypothetical protein
MSLVGGGGFAAFVAADTVLLDALLGDLDGVGAFSGGGAGEGAEELGDVDAAIVELAVDGLVHGGEEFLAEFVEDLVYIDVGHEISTASLLGADGFAALL